MCTLIEKQMAVPVSAPSMREVPIENNPVAVEFIRNAIQDRFPVIILMTGVGTEALFDVARSQGLFEPLLQAMQRATLIIRGPKPAAVLNRAGLRYDLKAPEPNTWRELLGAMDSAAKESPDRFSILGKQLAVQEYGLPNERFYAELESRGATLTAVPVYRWALPEDLRPLMEAVRRISQGEIDILLFTSANQIVNALEVAARLEMLDTFRLACQRLTVASIGPTCSEALADNGLPVHYEASPPKMGPLVRGAVEYWRSTRPSDATH